MKQIIAYFVSGNFINPTLLQCRVPLVPILGETYQCEMPTGEKLYAEEISHHPPILCFQVDGPNDIYKIEGTVEYKGTLNGPNSLSGWKEGR